MKWGARKSVRRGPDGVPRAPARPADDGCPPQPTRAPDPGNVAYGPLWKIAMRFNALIYNNIVQQPTLALDVAS